MPLPPESEFSKVVRYSARIVLIPENGGEGDVEDYSQSFQRLTIVKDFNSTIYPLFKLELYLSPDEIRNIQSKWKRSLFYITLDEWEENERDGIASEKTGIKYIDNESFEILNLDQNQSTKVSDIDSNSAAIPRVSFPIELIPSKAMSNNRVISNTIYTSCTIQDVLLAELSSNAQGDYRYLVSPPDNERFYEDVIVPPLPFNQVLDYLDRIFGLYKGNLQVFFDVDKGFILSTTKQTNEPEKFPEIHIELSAEELGGVLRGASARDSQANATRFRVSGLGSQIQFMAPAEAELGGETIRLVNTSQSVLIDAECQELDIGELKPSQQKPKERVIWKRFDNPLAEDKVKNERREAYSKLICNIDNAHLDVLTPWITIQVKTASPNANLYEGNWRIERVDIVLNKAGHVNSLIDSMAQLTLVPTSSEG